MVKPLSATRRGLLGFLLAAPVVITTPGLLMPVRPYLWGDGIHDDTAAIQWLLNRHKNVYLPAGKFRTPGVLTFPHGRNLIGAPDLQSVFIAMPNDYAVMTVRNHDDSDDVRGNLDGLMFYGTDAKVCLLVLPSHG